jgi:16S rRNA (cytosine967-C5)-methyltransferase
MTPSGRIAAAIDILADLFARSRPASMALKDWGQSHRFAGSKDRAAIASLVYDALRRKASAAWIMGEETPRGVMLGSLNLARGLDADAIAALCSGERFAPPPLSGDEQARLVKPSLADAPAHIAGDFPEWLQPSLERAFGDDLVPEMQALAQRAPLDIRVNRLKASRDQVQVELAHFGAEATPWSPDGLRMQVGEDGRGPSVQVEPAFLKGWFEVQDEGSQLAALMSGVKPGEQVVDLCAGAGGKTLALAAMMENRGQIFATDIDARRLAPLHDRLARSGAHNVQVRTPRGRWIPGGPDPLDDLAGRIDCVFVDAPCTGVGTWRRNPDAKWRLRPGALAERVRDQAVVLDRATRLVRPGGRIVYVTCSLLPEENDEAVEGFLARTPGNSVIKMEANWPSRETKQGCLLTPYRTLTDGFCISQFRKK